MNANELRIGNWLKNNNAISEIFDPYHRVIGKDISDLCENPLHEAWQQIEGIPLIPEILEKAGFENRSSTTDYLFEHANLIIGGSMRRMMPCVWGESGLEPFGENIQYVHQLQNLYFALTGEELEINL